MSEVATFINTVFLILITLYVCVQVALMIFEVRSVEASANSIPPQFREFITLSQHRKAIDYTGEVIQCDLVNALLGALVALVLTIGGGINIIWGGIITTLGNNLAAQFVLLTFLTFFLALIDIPLTWWKDFRINERYGYERTPAKKWLSQQRKEIFLGWLVEQPFLLLLLFVLTISSYYWWIITTFVLWSWYIWRVHIYPNRVLPSSKEAIEIKDKVLGERLSMLLRNNGFKRVKILQMPCPNAYKHGTVILARSFIGYRLVVFNHVIETLSAEEILALTACAIGRVNRWHNAARILAFTLLSTFALYGFSLLAGKPFLYEALGIYPSLALDGGAPIPAILISLVITVFPIVLYPLVVLIHAFTRMLIYDEDAYAVHITGAEPLIRALVKLHRDYKNTLTPNRFYSLVNHRRPHITLRISEALKVNQIVRINNRKVSEMRQADRAKLFNAILAKRNEAYLEKNAKLVRKEKERLLESDSLKRRTYSCVQS